MHLICLLVTSLTSFKDRFRSLSSFFLTASGRALTKPSFMANVKYLKATATNALRHVRELLLPSVPWTSFGFHRPCANPCSTPYLLGGVERSWAVSRTHSTILLRSKFSDELHDWLTSKHFRHLSIDRSSTKHSPTTSSTPPSERKFLDSMDFQSSTLEGLARFRGERR